MFLKADIINSVPDFLVMSLLFCLFVVACSLYFQLKIRIKFNFSLHKRNKHNAV